MYKFVKIVDGSAEMGKFDTLGDLNIVTKEKLFEVLKTYLDRLFCDIDEDSRLFWATYSMFVVKSDRICFCSCMNTGFPIYSVDVEKSDSTDIKVTSYKIDSFDDYVVTNLEKTMTYVYEKNRSLYKMISPLEVLGLSELVGQHWSGEICVRSNFTKWNMIDVKVNKKLIIENAI